MEEEYHFQSGQVMHCNEKFWFMYFQNWNWVASFPIPTFVYLWTIYIFPGWICLIRLQQNRQTNLENISISHSQIHECGNWETKHYNSVFKIMRPRTFISGNTYRNHTFILDSHRHRPFICSVAAVVKDSRHTKNKYNCKNMSSLMIWHCFFYFPNQISSCVPQVWLISVWLFFQNFSLRKIVFT